MLGSSKLKETGICLIYADTILQNTIEFANYKIWHCGRILKLLILFIRILQFLRYIVLILKMDASN